MNKIKELCNLLVTSFPKCYNITIEVDNQTYHSILGQMNDLSNVSFSDSHDYKVNISYNSINITIVNKVLKDQVLKGNFNELDNQIETIKCKLGYDK